MENSRERPPPLSTTDDGSSESPATTMDDVTAISISESNWIAVPEPSTMDEELDDAILLRS